MKTEQKGSETLLLQEAGPQMNTFPLSHFLTAYPHSSKRRQPKRDERKRDDSVLVLSHSLLSFFRVCFRGATRRCPPLITSSLSFHWYFLFWIYMRITWRANHLSVTHPFLTAHFDDYPMFEFFSIIPHSHKHTPLPPTHPLTVGWQMHFAF